MGGYLPWWRALWLSAAVFPNPWYFTRMDEKESLKIFVHESAMVKVFGGDLRERCRLHGLPDHLVEKFIAGEKQLDRFFSNFDEIGEPKKPEQRA
jgi:hypothetical protein